MKSIFFIAALICVTLRAQAAPFCQDFAGKITTAILVAENEKPETVKFLRAESLPAKGTGYYDELFDIKIKTALGVRCVTLKYFGSAGGCLLAEYHGVGCR